MILENRSNNLLKALSPGKKLASLFRLLRVQVCLGFLPLQKALSLCRYQQCRISFLLQMYPTVYVRRKLRKNWLCATYRRGYPLSGHSPLLSSYIWTRAFTSMFGLRMRTYEPVLPAVSDPFNTCWENYMCGAVGLCGVCA